MSKQDYITVRGLKLHQIPNNPRNQALVREYAEKHCSGFMQKALLQLAR